MDSVVDLVDLVGRIGPHSRKLVDYEAFTGRNHHSEQQSIQIDFWLNPPQQHDRDIV